MLAARRSLVTVEEIVESSTPVPGQVVLPTWAVDRDRGRARRRAPVVRAGLLRPRQRLLRRVGRDQPRPRGFRPVAPGAGARTGRWGQMSADVQSGRWPRVDGRRDDDGRRRAAAARRRHLLRRHRAAEHRREPGPRDARAGLVLIYESGRIGAKPDPAAALDRRRHPRRHRRRRRERARGLQLLAAARAHRRRVPRRRAARPVRQHQHDRDRRRLRPARGCGCPAPAARPRSPRPAARSSSSCGRRSARSSRRSTSSRRSASAAVPATASGSACAGRVRAWSSPTSASCNPIRDTCELTLTHLHPGKAVDDVRDATGWHARGVDGPVDDRTADRARARDAAQPRGNQVGHRFVTTHTARSSSSTRCARRSASTAAALAGVRPDDLAAHGARRRCCDRSPGARSRDASTTCCSATRTAPARTTATSRAWPLLLAGLPPSVPGATVNRLCGSGLEAVIEASRAIAVGDASVCIAGGVESMSRAPWVMLKPGTGFPRGHEQM